MKRRAVLAATAAVLAPGMARPQGRVRRIGVLMGFRENDAGATDYVGALMQGLNGLGWKPGANLQVDWRWAAGDPALFERYAAELMALHPDALVAQGTPSVNALRPKAGAVPIVFTIVTDPVGQGMVTSLAKPGGTITGFTDFDPSMASKWMELLTQIKPPVSRASVLFNPDTAPFAGTMMRAIEAAAPSFGIVARQAPCRDDAGIESMMEELARDGGGGGIVVLPDLFNLVHRATIIAAANRHRLSTVYFNRTFTTAGGLMSYGVDYADQFRRAASYVDRLLKGASAADLPIQQPDKFDLTINLKTARRRSVEIASNLLAIADDVID
jgi:putative tryptophan/tyrosine transport system substrate-binding protein